MKPSKSFPTNLMKQPIETDKLIADNQKLKKILDHLNISFVLFSLEFDFLDSNETFLEMTGAKRDKIIGRSMRTILSEEELLKVRGSMKGLQEKEHVQYEFFVFSTGRQRKIPCLFHASLNRDSEGTPTSVNMLFMSLVEQKKIQGELEKEKKMLEAILFGIRDCVSIFDETGNFLFGSPNSSQIRPGNKSPLLPLESEGAKQLTLDVEGRQRSFMGEMQSIFDGNGRRFAYAETLTDITNKIQLEEREMELQHIRRKLNLDSLQNKMIGGSKAMMNVFNTIQRCSEVDANVLITGETGVGKELAARAIHDQSHRKDRQFVAFNCTALSESLMESELFGHVQGAFTGAVKNRLGLFREAHKGTLFLDEIGELDTAIQVKLLRAIQEREIRPVGSDQVYAVNVKIICATNRNIHQMIETGGFRSDLYYRIAVLPLHLPPLRDRPDDIIRLAEHFLNKYQKNQKFPKTIDADAAELLHTYSWPGNVRELENAIEYACVMSKGTVLLPESFPKSILKPIEPDVDSMHLTFEASVQNLRTRKETEKKQEILHALAQCQDDRKKTADYLGVSRTTLWRRMRQYDIADK